MVPRSRRAATLSEPLGEALLVYDTERHTAHRLNSTAALVWKEADGTRTVEDLAVLLRNAGVNEADAHLVLETLDVLAEAGLMTGAPSPASVRLTRREALARVATVAWPLVASIVVPTPAEAQSYRENPGCYAFMNPNSVSVPAEGGTGTIAVQTTTGFCTWKAESNAAWLTATAGIFEGSKSFGWQAQANETTNTRTATITVLVKDYPTVSFTQAGRPAPCSVGVVPASATVGSSGGSGSVAVTSACAWEARSNAGWLTVSSASGTGNGTFTWTAAGSTGSATRTGTITVTAGGAMNTVTITQAGKPLTEFNGVYRGTATLRAPYGCGNFFLRSYVAAATVALNADGTGTVTHESITGGYSRVYTIRSVELLPNGDLKVVCGVQDWTIGGLAFKGQLTALISGTKYTEEEALTRADGSCKDYFDTVATKQ